MENDEQSRIPDPDVVVSPNNPDDPNEPATDAAWRRNVEAEVIGSSRSIPGPSEVESSSSTHEQHQPKYTKSEIEELGVILGASLNLKNIHEPVSQCIYKVPKDLRKINEEAYTPQVISIGPFHHGKTELSEMENKKLKYVLEFIKKEGVEKLKELKMLIQANEQLIRNHYQENSSLVSPEFVNMILCDAVFIIEFFSKNATVGLKDRDFDFCLDTSCVKAAITRDLQLLENQLPYFLLQNLFLAVYYPDVKKDPILYHDHEHDPFLILCRRFFFYHGGNLPKPIEQGYEIQHFTDLSRYFLLMDFLPQDQIQGEHVRGSPTAMDFLLRDLIQVEHARDLPTATKLQGSGVKFKRHEIGGSLEISCKPVPCAMRIPGFRGCEIPFMKTLELQIPHLEIHDRSECLYRNMMALELCHYPSETHICNFFLLMDYLINTEKDVDLFVEEGIIFCLMGDNAAIAKMFNRLCLQITPSRSVYYNIGEKLKAHYRRPWNRTMATLKTVYFGDIWKGTATVTAFILLVLTVIQAIGSILSVTL